MDAFQAISENAMVSSSIEVPSTETAPGRKYRSNVGIQQVAKADLSSDRNLMIVGFILFMGLSLPAYISGAPPFKIDGAARMRAIFGSGLGNIIVSLASSGMAVAAILGLILDNWIPGTDKERGVEAVEQEPSAPIT